MTPVAHIVSVRDHATQPGEKIVTVYCPYCREAHQHRGAELSVRPARCGSGDYQLEHWKGPA